jgi:phosphomannomutase
MKKIIVFDLDNTLTLPKQPMNDPEVIDLLKRLIEKKSIAIISGGSYSTVKKHFVSHFDVSEENLKKTFLLPTCGTCFYKFNNNTWETVYKNSLSEEEKKKIFSAFKKTFQILNYSPPTETYGEIIEDRETQVTFSGLGQKAPLEPKLAWDPTREKRIKIKTELDKHLLDHFDARVAGSTTIDVTKKGIDKAYGVEKLKEHLGLDIKDMLFIGDALFKGGNDYPVKKTGIDCIQVNDKEDTKQVLKKLLSEMD